MTTDASGLTPLLARLAVPLPELTPTDGEPVERLSIDPAATTRITEVKQETTDDN